MGLYCSNRRQQEYIFHTITIPRIERGEVSNRDTLRRYLVRRDGWHCRLCGTTDWRGKPLKLQVDHIDGDGGNDRPHNLRLLCPNCHSQTESWGNRNRGKGRRAQGLSPR